MPKIQLIIEAESARHLASVINQMAHRYKSEEEEAIGTTPTSLASPAEPPKGNGEDVEAGDEQATYVAPPAKSEFPSDKPALKGAAKANAERKAKAAAEAAAAAAAQAPATSEDEGPGELPPLDDLKDAITKAVLAEPQGGPVRTALEGLRTSIDVKLIKNCVEAHRPALWAFVQKNQISLGDQV